VSKSVLYSCQHNSDRANFQYCAQFAGKTHRRLGVIARQVLDAYKQLANNKNGIYLSLSYRKTFLTIFKANNVLQQAICHLTKGELAMTSETRAEKDEAIAESTLTLMPFARLFANFFPSFGPVYPPKVLLFSKTFFPRLSVLQLSIADDSFRMMISVRRSLLVLID
jgi:hypothetical protein